MAQPATSPKIEELRFRLKTDPKNRIFYPLAEELRKIGAAAEAEQVLRTGLAYHPTYLSAWVSLGRVLRELKNDGAAVEALSKALQIDPGNVVAARLLADAYLSLGEKVEAIKKFKLVQALMPGDEEVDATVERLEAELNPAAAAAPFAPPMEEAGPLEAAPLGEAPPAEASPFAEESPFAPEPEQAPFHATTEMPFAATSEAEAPFAAPPEVGEETATMRSPRPAAETPFAAEPREDEQPPFGETSPEAAAAHADSAPFGDQASELAAAPPAEQAEPWPADDSSKIVHGAAEALHREFEVEQQTGDAVPMSAGHSESPFEEPAGYGQAAFEVESPEGMHVSRAPLAADVPVDLGAGELPAPATASAEPPSLPAADEADVFAPSVEPQQAGADSFGGDQDLTNTLTMADLYARQGLIADARQIYMNILQRDPENDAVRAKLEALTPSQSTTGRTEEGGAAPVEGADTADVKVAKLEKWLSRVRREVGSV